MDDQAHLFPQVPFTFGPRFLHDHAGHIITDSRIAIVELVANSYDAGASRVDIQWPEKLGELLEVRDDGTGMTLDEFNHRWRTLSYSRPQEQGTDVEYPPGVKAGRRVAFGQNGKGRYSPFCFADEYQVHTWKDGAGIQANVVLTDGGSEPFHCTLSDQPEQGSHGTCIRLKMDRGPLPASEVREVVGSKFLVDPHFKVVLNGVDLELMSLHGLETSRVPVEPFGTLTIYRIGALLQDRTTQLRGITWWVNRRMVGTPSWSGLDERGAILDGRTAPAKRFSFIVEADFLKKDVRADWTGFADSKQTLAAQDAVHEFVHRALDRALSNSRKERKREALAKSRDAISQLPRLSRRLVGQFVDEVQSNCPSLSHADLARTASIYASMEVARSGYELLARLAACSPNDIDTWNRLMEEWSADNAEIVLSELKRRLDLIERLQGLVDVATTNELHDLQPLFARGLWIFGPEYESVDFTSNRAMATVICGLLGARTYDAVSARRPDFVALPDRSICCYAADDFDGSGEVSGFRKVLVVELKKGGFELGVKELRQGEDYARELRKANLVSAATEIVVYVLGSKLAEDATEDVTTGAIVTRPMTYERILKRAHARTFNLQQKLSQNEVGLRVDEDVEDVLGLNLEAPAFSGNGESAVG
jgi:Histidine kinase-, DNA gyrase B-, and HSP90-like ATPase